MALKELIFQLFNNFLRENGQFSSGRNIFPYNMSQNLNFNLEKQFLNANFFGRPNLAEIQMAAASLF